MNKITVNVLKAEVLKARKEDKLEVLKAEHARICPTGGFHKWVSEYQDAYLLPILVAYNCIKCKQRKAL